MSDSINKKEKNVPSVIPVIIKRELASYFTGPVAYIVTGLFLIFAGFLFFSTFFLINRADLRNFFNLLPVLFAFFIPALTMRSFSEEMKSGSFETLMTLPVNVFDAVLGKYLASFLFSCAMLLPTLCYVLTAAVFGAVDFGPIAGGYLGAVFLAASFSAVGVFASAVTKNQITAFFIGFAVCILLSMIDNFLVLLPSRTVSLLQFFSAQYHFNSVARGILDSRDLLYFASLSSFFIALTVKTLKARRAA
ncbi:MAG: ABC transporter permease [Bacteroides sp.]|nr:ABC transporter permease [Prevotella sp.]MCM1407383.1 ABC transporter permease [Treponema brennaborense]MCM1469873.1 ABC transporter permease [Bacteroides sp.]